MSDVEDEVEVASTNKKAKTNSLSSQKAGSISSLSSSAPIKKRSPFGLDETSHGNGTTGESKDEAKTTTTTTSVSGGEQPWIEKYRPARLDDIAHQVPIHRTHHHVISSYYHIISYHIIIGIMMGVTIGTCGGSSKEAVGVQKCNDRPPPIHLCYLCAVAAVAMSFPAPLVV
jgi:hypothetical protein